MKIERRLIRIASFVKRLMHVVALAAGGILVLCYLGLQFHTVQYSIRQSVQETLKESLHTEVSIENVEVPSLNLIALNGILIRDQKGDTLIYVQRAMGAFEILPLTYGKLQLNTLQLIGFDLRAREEALSDAVNYQFLIDALSSDRESHRRNIFNNLNLNSVWLRNGLFSYHKGTPSFTTEYFDPKHIEVQDISANMRVQMVDDRLHLHLKRLALKERSGLRVLKTKCELRTDADQWEMTHLQLEVNQSTIHADSIRMATHLQQRLADLSHEQFLLFAKGLQLSFVPADINKIMSHQNNIQMPIELATDIYGSNQEIEIPNLMVDFMDSFNLMGNISLTRFTEPTDSIQMDARITNCDMEPQTLKLLFKTLYAWDSPELHQLIDRLGKLEFKGVCKGSIAQLNANGWLSSRAGAMQGDLLLNANRTTHSMNFTSHLQTDSLHLGVLLGKPEWCSGLFANVLWEGCKEQNQDFRSAIKGSIDQMTAQGYTYHDILLDVKARGSVCEGRIEANDPNGMLNGYACLDMDRQQLKDIDVKVRGLRPAPLHWTQHKGVDSLTIAGMIRGEMWLDKQILLGNVDIDSLRISNVGKTLDLPLTTVRTFQQDSLYQMTAMSPLAQFAFQGNKSFRSLARDLMEIVGNQTILRTTLESIVPSRYLARQEVGTYHFEGTLVGDSTVSEILALPVTVYKDIHFDGRLNPDSLHCDILIPEATFFGTGVRDAHVLLHTPHAGHSPASGVTAHATGLLHVDNQKLEAHVEAFSDRDSLVCDAQTLLTWGKHSMAYDFGLKALSDSIDVVMTPHRLVINNSVWEASPLRLTQPEQGLYNFSNCRLRHSDQLIEVQGDVHHDGNYDFRIGLQQVGLEPIFDIVNKSYLEFGGWATGEVILARNNATSVLQTNELNVQNFAYHGYELGDGIASLQWDFGRKHMDIDANIFTAPNYQSYVTAFIQMGDADTLALNFDVDHLPIGFVNYYLEGILDDIEGNATGKASLYGRDGDYTLVGHPLIEQGSFGIGLLGSRYQFAGPLQLTPTSFEFKDVEIKDMNNYSCSASGTVNHTFLQDYRYNIDVQIPQGRSKGMLVFNHPYKPDDLSFWGQLYMDGRCHLEGGNGYHNFQINARTAPGSVFNLSPNENNYSDNTYNFLKFRRKIADQQVPYESQTALITTGSMEKPATPASVYNIDLIVEATPDCQINILMDPLAEDKLSCNGDGDLSINYNTVSDLNLMGQYNMNQGKYTITMRGDLLSKDFKIDKGSTVSFTGNPMEASLNVTATYSIPSVNLTDLDRDFAMTANLSRNTAPIDCKLRVTGDISSPQIAFDLDVKRVNSDVEAMVRNTIGTQEMMNRQVFYLLLFNKFYAMDLTNNEQGNNASDLTSFASASLTSQLNNLLGQMSEYVSIGTNIRTDKGDFSDMEMDLALSSSFLNNRLLFNGSVGYRDPSNNLNMAHSTSNSFIGDFDLEYLINRKGTLRLKAYSHYNEKDYSINNALTTQGVGIVMRKDFKHINDLLWWKKKENTEEKNRDIKK